MFLGVFVCAGVFLSHGHLSGVCWCRTAELELLARHVTRSAAASGDPRYNLGSTQLTVEFHRAEATRIALFSRVYFAKLLFHFILVYLVQIRHIRFVFNEAVKGVRDDEAIFFLTEQTGRGRWCIWVTVEVLNPPLHILRYYWNMLWLLDLWRARGFQSLTRTLLTKSRQKQQIGNIKNCAELDISASCMQCINGYTVSYHWIILILKKN